MNQYELALVIDAKLSNEIRDETLAKVKSIIEANKGTIIRVDDWGKQRLHYEIQNVKEAFYLFINFDASKSSVTVIEKSIRTTENVLRFIITKMEPHQTSLD